MTGNWFHMKSRDCIILLEQPTTITKHNEVQMVCNKVIKAKSQPPSDRMNLYIMQAYPHIKIDSLPERTGNMTHLSNKHRISYPQCPVNELQ